MKAKISAKPRKIAEHVAATAILISKSARPVGELSADSNGNQVPVFLIEDKRQLHDGFDAMLGTHGLTVIARSRSSAEALQQIVLLKPELVLLDATLGDRDSLHLVKAVKKLSPEIKVIIMHFAPGRDDVVRYVRAGVMGFVMKDASVVEVVSTIRLVANGASVLPPAMTEMLFSHVAHQATTLKKEGSKPTRGVPRLSLI
jgi:DNA-binding NarL/FixJ family response regulator